MKKLKIDKRFFIKALRIINRFAPYIEMAIFMFIALNYEKQSDKWYRYLLFIPVVLYVIRVIKWEYKCFTSKGIIRTTALQKRVQGFSGAQGAGKTSFMLFSAYCIKPSNVYSNFPAKLRGKYTYKLYKSVLNLDTRIDDGSLLMISEATMLYHNCLNNNKSKEEALKLYGQQLHQQIIRHCYDGNMFYDSVDLTRLPAMLKDNISLTNYLLGQRSVTLSFIVSPILNLISKKFFNYELFGSVRVWELQQFERIPEEGYTFDLSRQEKNTDTKNYANLLELCCWNDIQRFDYDDRFLRGIYMKLPQHNSRLWETLLYDEPILRELGYGELLDFFEAKLRLLD